MKKSCLNLFQNINSRALLFGEDPAQIRVASRAGGVWVFKISHLDF